MQLIYVKDLKACIIDYKSEELFVGMISEGNALGRIVKQTMKSGAMQKVDQYVRVPKYYCDPNRDILSSDEHDRLLILIVFWICSFSGRNGFKMKLSNLGKTFSIDTDYLKMLLEKYGKFHGLSLAKVMSINGQRYEIVRFSNPLSVKRESFENIF